MAAERCISCGRALRRGQDVCPACGVAQIPRARSRESREEPPAPPPPPAPRGRFSSFLRVAGVAAVVLAGLAALWLRLATREVPVAAPARALDVRQRAAHACDGFVRSQVKPPLAVRSVDYALVSQAGGGFEVSGGVTLQEPGGKPARRQFLCRVHQSPGLSEMLLDAVRIY